MVQGTPPKKRGPKPLPKNEVNPENGVKKRGPKKGSPRVGGRQKGTLNIKRPDGTTVRAVLHYVFEGLGGVDEFMAWGVKNKDEFYKMWSKMMPLEISGNDGGPIQTEELNAKAAEFTSAIARLVERQRTGAVPQ